MSDRTPDSILTRWIERHQQVVLRYLRALGAEDSEALDVAQDVFVLALERGVEDRGDAAARRFLRTTARRQFVRTRKRNRTVLPLDAEVMDRVDDLFAELHDEAGTADFDDALRNCLQKLAPRAREMVLMRHRDECGRTELAAAFGLGDAAVKQALRRARSTLRDCIANQLGDALPTWCRTEIER